MADQLEGSGAAQLIQLVQRFGYNKDTDIELGTVTAAPPSITVRLDNSPIELDKDDLIVAERVTIGTGLKAGDRVIVASVNGGQRFIILDRAVVY